MGGYVEIRCTLRHPGLFSRCYAIRPTADLGKESVDSLFELTAQFPEKYGKNTRYLDCVTGDLLLEDNLRLFNLMKQKDISIGIRSADAEHRWERFDAVLPAVFEFLGGE